MSGIINIDPESVRGVANDYGRQADELNGIIMHMDGLLEQLRGVWQGQASESYAQRYAELKQGFAHSEEVIREIVAALGVVANEYENMDRSIANALKG